MVEGIFFFFFPQLPHSPSSIPSEREKRKKNDGGFYMEVFAGVISKVLKSKCEDPRSDSQHTHRNL